MRYVDGFVLVIPKKNLAAYRRMAAKACAVWKKYGALDYKECLGDDLKVKMGIPFPKLAKLRRGEVVVFSYITYKSRADRDRVNAKVMKDPFMTTIDPSTMPFDCRRMAYGGFKVIVDSKK